MLNNREDGAALPVSAIVSVCTLSLKWPVHMRGILRLRG